MDVTTEPARKPKKQDDAESYWARRELGKATDRVGRLRKEVEQLRAELAESQAENAALRKKVDWLRNVLCTMTTRRMEAAEPS